MKPEHDALLHRMQDSRQRGNLTQWGTDAAEMLGRLASHATTENLGAGLAAIEQTLRDAANRGDETVTDVGTAQPDPTPDVADPDQ